MPEKEEKLMMSLRELYRLELIEAVLDRELSLTDAAASMEITPRHCRRLIAQYVQAGPVGLISQRRGKPGNHQLPGELKARVIHFLKTESLNMGPTQAQRMLVASESINLSVETVRQLMIAEKLWQQKSKPHKRIIPE
ncbi:TPA: helix-turn-helix domain-containing protein [Salmonella enterica]|uniref:Helix-turn-helix domain-containing protein n=2 Tax=Salmonella enterica TaxID=28901 RepID=A0A3V4IL49_SALER|nr:helix-turn-helix domain-containing protein [Salmonella enterica]ECC9154977.1 helix-turn-helix domain-containing protein [Salmonella enterica subsp. salamae]HCM1849846.1 helix-turn-helix domain containing protein [Salmonella enterica subsp. salamae serovar 42:z29:-]AZT24585.1 helix-turn-helix domain-containing protein [Salmonella enterica subsp. salamae serovar 42:r:-]AZT50850.1 helix-turn-helix domain-containing protein [Salmonella enterica subsp. salamae serovar 42:r:-]AZT55242.1 helix-tur